MRLGAAIGPENVMQIFSKLGTNDESCTNHFIQYGGIEFFTLVVKKVLKKF